MRDHLGGGIVIERDKKTLYLTIGRLEGGKEWVKI